MESKKLNVDKNPGINGQNHLTRRSETGEENEAEKGRDGKKPSGYGQAWALTSPTGQWRIRVKMDKPGCRFICGGLG